MTETNDQLNVGDVLKGTVVKVEDKHVLVDINYKTEGIVPISELSYLHVENPADVVSEGEELTLSIKKIDDDEVILSKKIIDGEKAWESLQEKLDNGDVIETEVKEVVNGGLVVDVGLRGFIPASLVETHYVDDFSDYLNKTLQVKIVDLDKEQNRVILSHRAVLEAELAKEKEELLQSLEVGQVIDGTVQRITDFGAFVDIGGVDGLVHISELAHSHVAKVSDVVSEGDAIKVEVLAVDVDAERISLSHKNTIPGPWSGIEDKFSAGDTVEGTVQRLVDFGAFVEIADGVEGLVHISQIANRHIEKPQDVLEVGQSVKAKILSVSEADERISLSIKELEQDNEKKEIEQYERQDDDEGSGFQLGDMIGDKLDKYKS